MLFARDMDNLEVVSESFLLEMEKARVLNILKVFISKDAKQGLVVHCKDEVGAAKHEVPCLA